MLISFSGIDCAGKSTQIQLLRSALEQAGRTVEVVWHRPGYSPELVAAKALVRRVRPSALPTVDAPREREEAFSNGFVRRSFVLTSLLDTMLQFGLKIRAKQRTKSVVICDRYLDDALIDLALRFPQEDVRSSLAARAAPCLVPRPTVAVLLTVPYETMLARMEQKQEPFPDSAEIRDKRYLEYKRLESLGQYLTIASHDDASVVHQKILATVMSARGAPSAD